MKIYLGDQSVGLGTYVDVNTQDSTADVEDVIQGEVFYNKEGRQVGTHVCPTVEDLLNEKITKYTKMAVDVCKPTANKTLNNYPFTHSLGETPRKAMIFDIDNSSVKDGYLLHLTAMTDTAPIYSNSNYCFFTWNSGGSCTSQYNNSSALTFNETTITINLSGLSVAKNREYMIVTFA